MGVLKDVIALQAVAIVDHVAQVSLEEAKSIIGSATELNGSRRIDGEQFSTLLDRVGALKSATGVMQLCVSKWEPGIQKAPALEDTGPCDMSWRSFMLGEC